MEYAVTAGGAQRNMQMAALARNAVGPLGHEGRHQAMALREYLGIGFEQRRAVRGLEGVAVDERRFENTRAGFGVQPLDRKSHGLAEIEKLLVQIRMHRAAQYRIAERT